MSRVSTTQRRTNRIFTTLLGSPLYCLAHLRAT